MADFHALADPTDAALVRDVAAGSEAALASLYDRHAPLVFGDRAPAHARPQPRGGRRPRDVPRPVERRRAVRSGTGSLTAWLTVVARHAAIDRHRRNARADATLSMAAIVAGRPDEAEAMESVLRSSRLVARRGRRGDAAGRGRGGRDAGRARRGDRHAAADERDALLLAYRDGLSQSEIAARLGWPLGTVKTRSRRALRRLRTVLAEPAPARPAGTVGPGDAVPGALSLSAGGEIRSAT